MSGKYELIDAEYASAPAGNGHAPTITRVSVLKRGATDPAPAPGPS